MHYIISLVVFIYAISAVIDTILGVTTVDFLGSYLFRAGAITAVLAIYVHITYRRKIVGPLLLILASTALSIAALTLGRADSMATVSLGIKIASAILSVKPEMIELEIITEDEEIQQI